MKGLVQISMLALVGASCQKPLTPAKNWSFAENIGLAVLKSGRICSSIHNASLEANSRVQLVITSPPQMEADARISKIDPSCPDIGTGAQRYEVRAENAGLTPSMPVIAVVGFSGKFNRHAGLVAADLDGDGKEEYFRSCASTEGIHFTVWSGKPLEGELRWHEYYYLGYDVSPTCTETDVQPPK